MNVDINEISFLATILATTSVVGVSVYGAVRCIAIGKYFAGIGAIAMIPVWFVAQLLMLVIYDKLHSQGFATRAYHLDYALTPLLNLAGAALIWYVVIHTVRRLASSSSHDQERASQADAHDSAWRNIWEPKKIAGAIFLVVAATVMSAGFVISGSLFVVIGISLIMDVQIWRN